MYVLNPNEIKWLFFDLGSTLVDETDCNEKRFEEICVKYSLPLDEFKSKVYEFAKTQSSPCHAAVKFYGVKLTSWRKKLEKPYPEAKELLKKLSSVYKIGIIANQCPGTRKRLSKWGLLEYIDVLVASADEGCAKPERKIFNVALERAGCNPENAVMIGDRIDNDIIPAQAIGMKTVWIKQGFASYMPDGIALGVADFTVNTLNELYSLIIG